MNEKDLQKLMELATDKLAKGVSEEEALRNLVNAGILSVNGQFTEPYGHLREAELPIKECMTSDLT